MAHGMTRIRTIKPSFWSSPDIAQLSIEATLLAVGLISFADDDGRFVAGVNAIRGYVFPNKELPDAKVKRWLTECENAGFVRTWTVGNARYGVIPKFTMHQRINRPTPSILPPPPSDGLF